MECIVNFSVECASYQEVTTEVLMSVGCWYAQHGLFNSWLLWITEVLTALDISGAVCVLGSPVKLWPAALARDWLAITGAADTALDGEGEG